MTKACAHIGWLLLGVFGCGSGILRAVEVGSSANAVIVELGEPTGRIASGSREVWYFPAGEVRFREGRVIAFELLSEAQVEVRARQAREADTARLAEGRALLARKENSVDFKLATPDAQLRFYRWFSARYPEIAIGDAFDTVLARREAAREKAAEEARRVAAAPVVVVAAAPVAADRERRIYRWPTRWNGFCAEDPREDAEAPPPGPPRNSIDATFAREMSAFEESERRIWALMSGF